jgi:hypothetical protein
MDAPLLSIRRINHLEDQARIVHFEDQPASPVFLIMSESVLAHARYGKDFIRVFRVVRGSEFHQVVEYNVSVMLEGDIDPRSVMHSLSCHISLFLIAIICKSGS